MNLDLKRIRPALSAETLFSDPLSDSAYDLLVGSSLGRATPGTLRRTAESERLVSSLGLDGELATTPAWRIEQGALRMLGAELRELTAASDDLTLYDAIHHVAAPARFVRELPPAVLRAEVGGEARPGTRRAVGL